MVLKYIGGDIANTIVTSFIGEFSIVIIIAIIIIAINAYTKLNSQSQEKK